MGALRTNHSLVHAGNVGTNYVMDQMMNTFARFDSGAVHERRDDSRGYIIVLTPLPTA